MVRKRSAMGTIRYIAALLCVLFLVAGCSSDAGKNEDYYIKINNFSLSEQDVNEMIRFENELESNFYMPDDARAEFLENLIQTQLLIQEAKKMELDQSERFRKSIQLHWESTLIRDLLTQKSEEIKKTTIVTDNEVAAYFAAHHNPAGTESLETMKADIISLLEEEKISAQLNTWIESLKNTAVIDIRDEEIAKRLTQPKTDG